MAAVPGVAHPAPGPELGLHRGQRRPGWPSCWPTSTRTTSPGASGRTSSSAWRPSTAGRSPPTATARGASTSRPRADTGSRSSPTPRTGERPRRARGGRLADLRRPAGAAPGGRGLPPGVPVGAGLERLHAGLDRRPSCTGRARPASARTSPTTPRTTWSSTRRARCCRWPGGHTLEGFSRLLDGLDLFPSPPEREASRDHRRWAYESAALDLALRQAGRSLADALGRRRPSGHVRGLPAPAGAAGGRPGARLAGAGPGAALQARPHRPRGTRRWWASSRRPGRWTPSTSRAPTRGTLVDGAPDPALYRRVAEGFPERMDRGPGASRPRRTGPWPRTGTA